LSAFDPDFLERFRVQADFNEDMPRNVATERQLVQLLGTIARREGMRPLDREAAARLTARRRPAWSMKPPGAPVMLDACRPACAS
jgi:predicted ATP-dependent protease